MAVKLPSVIPCQCGAICSQGTEKEPCWGNVEVIDQEQYDDGDFMWVHACEGHADCMTLGGKYIPYKGEEE